MGGYRNWPAHKKGKFRRKLWAGQGRRCAICGDFMNQPPKKLGDISQHGEDPSVDHIIPKARGGTDKIENLQLVHYFCNWAKGDDTQHMEVGP